MSDFNLAVEVVLENEGGYVNDPNDPGGETNFGISKRSYPDIDIRNLTREQAIEIYKRDFWKFGGIVDQRVATKVFDAYVNAGSHAIRQAQLALGTLLAGPIVADGAYGPQTEDYLNAVDEGKFMEEYKARLSKMHCDDAVANSAQMGDLLGWLRRDVKG